MLEMARQESELWEIRTKLGLSVRQLWERLGSPGTLTGFRNYQYRKAPEDLLFRARLLMSEPALLRPLRSTGWGKLRVVGSIGAGGTTLSIDEEEELDVPIEFSREEWRGFIVSGDGRSMMPYLHPGDTVVLQEMPIVKLNKFMAIRLHDEPGRLMVKKVGFDQRTGDFIFESLNPVFPNVDSKQLSVVGLVIGFISADSQMRIGPYTAGIDKAYIEQQFRSRLPVDFFE